MLVLVNLEDDSFDGGIAFDEDTCDNIKEVSVRGMELEERVGVY